MEAETQSCARIVLCMRWGSLYPSTYVNVLHAAVRHHMTGSFRFVCLTNEPAGLNPEIEHYPIPDIGFRPEHWEHGCWPKLTVFMPDLYGLRGRALFLDLDSLVVGNLDSFFKSNPGVVVLDWSSMKGNHQAPNREVGTGVFAFTLGSESQIVRTFHQSPEAAVRNFRLEQNFVQAKASSIDYWPRDWVVSFKLHQRRGLALDLFSPPHEPAPSTRIVAFHGNPRPIDLTRPGIRGDFPHLIRSPVSWVSSYWRRYCR